MDELERHRIARRLNGFPIYDEDEIIGVVDEPEWDWASLTQDQQTTIRRESMTLQRGRELSWDEAFSFILGDYGVRCPHSWIERDLTWRECRWCRCAEQLPGRVVKVGLRLMRVSDPPPPILRIPIPAPPSFRFEGHESATVADAGPTIVEYEWTDSRYKLASR